MFLNRWSNEIRKGLKFKPEYISQIYWTDTVHIQEFMFSLITWDIIVQLSNSSIVEESNVPSGKQLFCATSTPLQDHCKAIGLLTFCFCYSEDQERNIACWTDALQVTCCPSNEITA